MLNVVTFKYKGRRNYQASHVNALYAMVRKYIPIADRFLCITDDRADVSCETYPMWHFPEVKHRVGWPNNYRCLRLFELARTFLHGRVLVLDLDILLLSDISDLVNIPDKFAIIKGRVAPYNSSMYLFTAGDFEDILSDFNPDTAYKVTGNIMGSDQAWLYHKIKDAKLWTNKDGIYSYANEIRSMKFACPKMVYFPGELKPWDSRVQKNHPHLFKSYQDFLVGA